ncbi:MAG: SAM-dependent methyltransferase [Flavobacteriales bacterium]|nr:SAM-dependent methyltransferase [Flavobacteriales bacterium]
MSNSGEIFLIPSPIEQLEEYNLNFIPLYVKNTIKRLDYFAVENIRTARRFIKKVERDYNIDKATFILINKKSSEEDINEIIKKVQKGKDVGVISEAGCPGIADPGQKLCEKAHTKNIKINPMIGPSSITLALMASGLNGQEFKFHGYLPIDKEERKQKIREISKQSGSHIFIETPYRNNHLLSDLTTTIPNKKTKLCIAYDICGLNENITTKTIYEWKNNITDIKGKPTIFIFGQ